MALKQSKIKLNSNSNPNQNYYVVCDATQYGNGRTPRPCVLSHTPKKCQTRGTASLIAIDRTLAELAFCVKSPHLVVSKGHIFFACAQFWCLVLLLGTSFVFDFILG